MSTGVWTSSSVRIRKCGLEEAAGGFFPRACETGMGNIINTTLVKSQAGAVASGIWRCTQASTATLFSQSLPARAIRITQEEAVV